MSRSLLHDWEHAIDRCCRDDNPKEMISIAEDIYNTAYVRGQNHSNELEEVLDKIRAEIEQLSLHKAQYLTSDNKVCIDSQDVFNVIDKYKAEIEPQESEGKE